MSEYCVSRIIDDNLALDDILHSHTGPATGTECDSRETFNRRVDAMRAWNMLRSPTVREDPIWWHRCPQDRGVRGRMGIPAIVLIKYLHKNAKKMGRMLVLLTP
jgi:hypothetical protein